MNRIAFGGMAQIYRAKIFDPQGHAHFVVVKQVLSHLAENENFIQMLVEEAKITSLLKHHNIAQVYEFAHAQGQYFIAMEHVDGKNLYSTLKRCRQEYGPIPLQHAAYIAAEIASGLHAAHTACDSQGQALKIVHRDISPSNIILSYAGDVKICDFGIAKTTLSKIQTRAGVIKGKLKYMSPEQTLGQKLDHRSDIFSLGSCLYELLTQIPPFTATSDMGLILKIRKAKYQCIRDLVPTIPKEIEEIVDRCLRRPRALRFKTANECATALRTFLQRYVGDYSPPHLGQYLRKLFAPDIEKDLRLLEEYVISDDVPQDPGENLIKDVLGPNSDFSQFRPKLKPTVETANLEMESSNPILSTSQVATNPQSQSSTNVDNYGEQTLILPKNKLAARCNREENTEKSRPIPQTKDIENLPST